MSKAALSRDSDSAFSVWSTLTLPNERRYYSFPLKHVNGHFHSLLPPCSHTDRPKGRQSICDPVFYFLIPPTKVRRALTMTSIENFCALLVAVVGGNGLSGPYIFIVKWKHSNPFSAEYKNSSFYKNSQTVLNRK